jgi:hypothetical protein
MREYNKRIAIQKDLLEDAIYVLREADSEIKDKHITELAEKSTECRQWSYIEDGSKNSLVTIKHRKDANLCSMCTVDWALTVNFDDERGLKTAEKSLEKVNLAYIRDGKKIKTSGIRLNIWKKDYSPMSDEQLSVLIDLTRDSIKTGRG